ncbi:MAG: class II aldolase/adducin family protein [Myxococcota bacterium]
MSERERRDVVKACQWLHQKGFLAAYDGNVSVRLDDDRVLVTPSGVHKGFLEPGDLVEVDLTGRKLSGPGAPTGELAMHLEAYRRRPDARAVVHAHPPVCIAMSLGARPLNGFLPEVTLSIGRFTVVPYARPLTDELARAVGQALTDTDAVILERHGTVAVGKDVAEAYAFTERLEHAAHVLWLAHALGNPRPLDESELRALENLYARRRAATPPLGR